MPSIARIGKYRLLFFVARAEKRNPYLLHKSPLYALDFLACRPKLSRGRRTIIISEAKSMFGWFKKARATTSHGGDAMAAITECDYELAESLRGSLTPAQVRQIVDAYRHLGNWGPKDIAVHLLQDCEPSQVVEVMRDALRSPTAESRAIAFCSLANDFNLFSSFVRDGIVDPHLVDRAFEKKFGA